MSIRTMFGFGLASIALAVVGCRCFRSRSCETCVPYGGGAVSPAPLYAPGAAPTYPSTVPLQPSYPSTTPSPYVPSGPPYEGSAAR